MNSSALIASFPSNTCNESLINQEFANNLKKLSPNQPLVHVNDRIQMDLHLCGISCNNLTFRIVNHVVLPVLNSRQILNEARKVSIRSKNEHLQQMVHNRLNSNRKPTSIEKLRKKYFKMCDVTFVTKDDEVRIQWPIFFARHGDDNERNEVCVSYFHRSLFRLSMDTRVVIQVHGPKRSCGHTFVFQHNQIVWNKVGEHHALIQVQHRHHR